MRVSREQMAEHRRQIIDAASKLFREKGFEAVTVAQVMAAAGLTHGGFYRHFASKDALIAAAIAEALDRAAADPRAFPDYLAGYLSKAHRDRPGEGCPVAGLGPAAIREGPEARAVMTEALRRQIDRFVKEAPGKNAAEKRQAAIAAWSGMVGALILARLADDEALSDEILAATRTSIAGRLSR